MFMVQHIGKQMWHLCLGCRTSQAERRNKFIERSEVEMGIIYIQTSYRISYYSSSASAHF